MCSRCISGKPYTACAISSGHACFMLYHCSHSSASRRRKSADRSTTRTPALTAAAHPSWRRRWASQKTPVRRLSAAAQDRKIQIDTAAQAGKHLATASPALLARGDGRELDLGCCASRRRSSTPVYPVPPTIPILIIFRSHNIACLTATCMAQTKKPPEGGLSDSRNKRSALGELLAAARLVQADLLSLHFARIARHQSRLASTGFSAGS